MSFYLEILTSATSIETFRTLLVMSITGAIIAVLLFVARPLLKNHLPKAAQYYLWLVVIAAFLVPFSRFISLPASTTETPSISKAIDWYVVDNAEIFERTTPYKATLPDGYIGVPEENMAAVEALVPEPWFVELLDWAKLIWAVGVIASLAVFLCSYWVFVTSLKQSNVVTNIDCKIPVYRNKKAATPMLIGLFSPIIVLPDREYTDAEFRDVLLHELTHLRRKDILVKWLSVFACSLHWFNPLAWLTRREIDRACELACDEAVIRELDADGKQSYGDTLIAVAADSKMPRTVLSTTMCENKKSLKERLGAIMAHRKATRLTLIISAVLIVVVGVGAALIGAGSENSYDFRGFHVNGYGLGTKIDISKLTPSTDGSIMYAHNYKGISFDTDENGLVSRFRISVSENGITSMSTPSQNPKGASFANIGYGIKDIENIFGKGKIGWYSQEQGLRSETYFDYSNGKGNAGAISIEFVYTDGGDNGINNRLIWVNAEIRGASASSSLIEFEAIYLNETADSYIVTFKRGDITYTDYIVDGALQQSGTAGLKEIGFARGRSGDVEYKIYQREGYSIDDFLVVDDEGFMNMATIYVGGVDKTPEISTGYQPRELTPFTAAEFTLPDFPNTTFTFDADTGTLSDANGLILGGIGVYVENVFLADLTGDGKPEFCATIAFGSGIVDSRIVVYDYTESRQYEMSDRGNYNYALSLQDGNLVVTQYEFGIPVGNGVALRIGELVLNAGELIVIGIDRTPQNIVDLTEKRDFTVHAEDLSAYRFFTNSKKISYSVSGALAATGKLTLYDAETGYSIMEADLGTSTKGAFANLTAAKTYYLTIPVADDTVIVIND